MSETAGMYSISPVCTGVGDLGEAGHRRPVAVGRPCPAHRLGVVERRRDQCQRLDPRVEGAVAQGVAAAQADADAAEAAPVDGLMSARKLVAATRSAS